MSPRKAITARITPAARRRRDHAIRKALGMDRRQVRAAVVWQAVTPVAVAT